MFRSVHLTTCVLFSLAAQRVFAGDPGPTQTTSPDGNTYHSPIPVNDPFPDNYYGDDLSGDGENPPVRDA